jgi:threonine dehydratase
VEQGRRATVVCRAGDAPAAKLDRIRALDARLELVDGDFDVASERAAPSAALGIAAILEDRDRFAGRHVATIVCGSNVDLGTYHRWVGAAVTHGS